MFCVRVLRLLFSWLPLIRRTQRHLVVWSTLFIYSILTCTSEAYWIWPAESTFVPRQLMDVLPLTYVKGSLGVKCNYSFQVRFITQLFILWATSLQCCLIPVLQFLFSVGVRKISFIIHLIWCFLWSAIKKDKISKFDLEDVNFWLNTWVGVKNFFSFLSSSLLTWPAVCDCDCLS